MRTAPRHDAVVYAIYRRTNSSFLRGIVQEARERGWTVVLWALDETSPEFAEETVGSGAGTKFGIVRRMVALRPPTASQCVLVTDDDVLLDRGTLDDLMTVAFQARVDLAQPAHSARSYWSHRITIARPFVRMRLTNFVEIGPLFVVMPWAQQLLYELPDDMGWGYELTWWEQWRDGTLRLGVVDDVRITHTVPAAGLYGADELVEENAGRLRDAGFRSWGQLQRTTGTWFRWQSAPPRRMLPAR